MFGVPMSTVLDLTSQDFSPPEPPRHEQEEHLSQDDHSSDANELSADESRFSEDPADTVRAPEDTPDLNLENLLLVIDYVYRTSRNPTHASIEDSISATHGWDLDFFESVVESRVEEHQRNNSLQHRHQDNRFQLILMSKLLKRNSRNKPVLKFLRSLDQSLRNLILDTLRELRQDHSVRMSTIFGDAKTSRIHAILEQFESKRAANDSESLKSPPQNKGGLIDRDTVSLSCFMSPFHISYFTFPY